MIVAMTDKRVIGKRGGLPWHISEDLKRFKKLTTGQMVVMGKNTYESIGRPLPNRENIVLDSEGKEIAGVHVCRSIPETLELAEGFGREIFVIGGASVYEQLLPMTDVLHISQVKKNYPGDVYFPEVDWREWTETDREEFEEFTAVTYTRRSNFKTI